MTKRDFTVEQIKAEISRLKADKKQKNTEMEDAFVESSRLKDLASNESDPGIKSSLLKDAETYKNLGLKIFGDMEDIETTIESLERTLCDIQSPIQNDRRAQNQAPLPRIQSAKQGFAPINPSPKEPLPSMSEMQAQTVQGPASNSLISDGQPQVVNPKNLYPTMARQAQPLPPLVRRNGLALSRSETSFPAMGYDEDVYEPWPIDAVERAVELYPDLKKREPAMRQLVTLPPEPIEPPVVLVQSTPPEPVNPFEPGRSDPRIRRPW